ncbi:MAG: quinolinate synthase NadA [Syntrophobacteraceae bacterium]
MTNSIDYEETIRKIREKKRELGKELLILTHQYQRKEIVDLGDYLGDSFALSKKAASDRECRYIVFCGVHFMAESAAILAQPHQSVQIPCLEAGCWMAEMADPYSLEKAWGDISSVAGEESLTAVLYINSDAALKAFCGRKGGIICTSSNADSALQWGFSRREKILFLPDQNLGRNVGAQMGIRPDEMIVWDPNQPLGGNSPERIKEAKLILWNGYCLVHTRFTVEDIERARKKFPGAKIVVHPECTQEVVALSDACGSTSFIVDYVKKAPANSTVIVGTEINLVSRLAIENPDKRVLELRYSLCPNMFKINPGNLLETLEHIGRFNVVTLPEPIKSDARLALERMMSLTARRL